MRALDFLSIASHDADEGECPLALGMDLRGSFSVTLGQGVSVSEKCVIGKHPIRIGEIFGDWGWLTLVFFT